VSLQQPWVGLVVAVKGATAGPSADGEVTYSGASAHPLRPDSRPAISAWDSVSDKLPPAVNGATRHNASERQPVVLQMPERRQGLRPPLKKVA